MTIADLIAAFFLWCLRQPEIRDVVEESIVGIVSDILFRAKSDPVFKAKYLELSGQLGQAKTPEEKRAILIQIRALRAGTATLPE